MLMSGVLRAQGLRFAVSVLQLQRVGCVFVCVCWCVCVCVGGRVVYLFCDVSLGEPSLVFSSSV